MKRKSVLLLIAIFAVAQVFALTQQKPKSKTDAKLVITKTEIEQGKQSILKSDCFACHKERDKLLGPSYKQVADKYPLTTSTLTLLSGKIKEGGKGVWGQIPMSPHPNLSQNEANMMVKYIMSLKSSK